jgi:hypothetical protein
VGHVYAPLGTFKRYLSGGDPGDTRDAEMLVLLESASRTVDGFCRRGSGFGPVSATKSYRSRGTVLRLQADLLDPTEVLIEDVAYTGYEVTDARHLEGAFGWGRAVDVTGSWGYADDRSVIASLSVAMTASDVTAQVDDGGALDIGQTVLIDTEQLLVTDITGDVLTVRRAENGTIAAAHDYASDLEVYRYAAEVIDATLRVGQRRWKTRDSGLTGTFDTGLGIPLTAHQDSEVALLRSAVGHLRFALVY